MKLQVFSVFDLKAKAFLPPFFMANNDVAIRIFSECANSKSHQFGRYSTDFCLFNIGEFDDVTGILEPSKVLNNLGLAASFVSPVSSINLPEVCDE